MKLIIGRGCKSRGLCILKIEVPKRIACSRVISLFELHCRLGQPSLSLSLSLLKKLYP